MSDSDTLNVDASEVLEPIDILNEVKDLPMKEEDINLNLDKEENDNVASKSSFYYLELIKNILFQILDIIYNRFFDAVNDCNNVYKETIDKLN
tara:strand:+ start:7726 stop:8004 length:279 start_codon:yes stop_codon:yes gene_type:complete